MNKKVVGALRNVTRRAVNAMDYIMVVAPGIIYAANLASAAGGGGSASGIFTAIIKIMGGFAVIRGIMSGYSGFSDYAEAKGEGEGPAMAKAKSELASAIMLVAIGVAAATFASTFASMITSAMAFT